MPIELTRPITVTQTATGYQVTAILVSFYDRGGPMENCTLAIRGRKGSGDGAEFQQLQGPQGVVDIDLHDGEVIELLNIPVAQLPQDRTLIEVLMALVDSTLRLRGAV
jgi:hypothetical protein